jgi:hypothetical protein
MPEQERLDGAARFGIHAEGASVVIDSLTELMDAKQVLCWSTLVSEEAVREVLRFVPETLSVRVIGLGLRPRHLQTLLSDAPEPDAAPEMVAREQPMPAGGVDLGFELLGFGYRTGKAHSWLCNSLESVFDKRFRIKPLSSGFLAEEDAEAVSSALAKDEISAEPLLWLPWLIRDYSAHFART